MNYKQKLTSFSLLATVISIVLVYLIKRSCTTDFFLNGVCFDRDMLMNVRAAIFIFPFLVFIFSLILLPFREEIFQSWKKFAKIYLSVSIAIILFFTFSDGRGGNFGVGGGMDTEGATMLFSAIFFIVSMVIIIVKSMKLRGK